jgi:hypothetical protein
MRCSPFYHHHRTTRILHGHASTTRNQIHHNIYRTTCLAQCSGCTLQFFQILNSIYIALSTFSPAP